MNRWQEHYISTVCGGKIPRTRHEKRKLELLGNVAESVTVHFPDFNGIHGFETAHTETFRIELDDCNMPDGIINVRVLAGNLMLWTDRGYTIDY